MGITGWNRTWNLISIIPYVAQLGKIAVQDPRWAKNVVHPRDYETKSMLCAPVVVEDKVVAVIQLLNKFLGFPWNMGSNVTQPKKLKTTYVYIYIYYMICLDNSGNILVTWWVKW